MYLCALRQPSRSKAQATARSGTRVGKSFRRYWGDWPVLGWGRHFTGGSFDESQREREFQWAGGWGKERKREREGTALCAVHVSVGPCQPRTQERALASCAHKSYMLVLLTH